MDAEVVCAELRIPPVRCCRCVGHALQCLQSMKSGRGYAAKDASLDAVAATLLPAFASCLPHAIGCGLLQKCRRTGLGL